MFAKVISNYNYNFGGRRITNYNYNFGGAAHHNNNNNHNLRGRRKGRSGRISWTKSKFNN